MKTLLFSLAILVLGCSFASGQQRIDAHKFPYNQKHHSIKQHSKFISGSYAIIYHLDRKKSHALYHELRGFYQSNSPINPLVEVSPQEVHTFLKERLKDYLTYSQYEDYLSFKNYFELIMAPGGPILIASR
jgi:hypothetical protein